MLARGIQKWDLVLLIINSIIGAGIFGLPSKIFQLSGVYSLAAFGVCAAVVLIYILCFAEVSSRFKETGGPYLYIHSAFGPFPGFIMGWLLLLSRIFNYATLINLLVTYTSFFSEALNTTAVRIIVILIVTTVLTYINHIGIKNATRVSNFFTIAKLLPLSIFIIAGLFFLQPEAFAVTNEIAISSFSTSVLLLIFAFGGFESVLVNSGEVHNPSKNLPFALITAILVVVIFYCLIQVVCIGTLPSLASSSKPLAEAATGFMGPFGGNLMAAGALVSIFGTLNVIMLSGSRLPFAFSNERQFPQFFSFVHPKYLTPTWSLLLVAALAAIISITWTFLTALTIAAIIRVLLYLFVCASLIKLRQKNKSNSGYFKLRGGKVLALAAILISLWLLSASKLTELRDTGICLAIGIIFYFLQQHHFKKINGAGNTELKNSS
ncbi:MAG: APC family permease [Chitinophagaceae bacterium]